MSISFNISQARQMLTLTSWLESATGQSLETAFEYQRLFTSLDGAYYAYRRGKLPLSEVRKHHRAVCDFLMTAARRHPALREF